MSGMLNFGLHQIVKLGMDKEQCGLLAFRLLRGHALKAISAKSINLAGLFRKMLRSNDKGGTERRAPWTCAKYSIGVASRTRVVTQNMTQRVDSSAIS